MKTLLSRLIPWIALETILALYTPLLFAAVLEPGFPNTLGNRDFISLQNNSSRPQLTLASDPTVDSCRANIQKVICLVEPTQKGQAPTDRPCLDGGQTYAIYFEQLYDNYPPLLQRMFCSLRHIYIEKQFFGTAYAGSLHDKDGKLDGALVGIRQSVLDQNLSLQTWSSWKEQLSFGGVSDSYSIRPELPRTSSHTAIQVNDFLYFVIAHEFGHLFDFANELNKQLNCPEPEANTPDPECKMADGSWGSLSWITDKTPHPENEFTNRKNLCFYNCKNQFIAPTDVLKLYQDLDNSPFISNYAAVQPWDDFADSIAYYLIFKNLSSNYELDTSQGVTYDIKGKLESPIFKAKKDYLESFLNNPNIRYP